MEMKFPYTTTLPPYKSLVSVFPTFVRFLIATLVLVSHLKYYLLSTEYGSTFTVYNFSYKKPCFHSIKLFSVYAYYGGFQIDMELICIKKVILSLRKIIVKLVRPKFVIHRYHFFSLEVTRPTGPGVCVRAVRWA